MDGKAVSTATTFSRTTSVENSIKAKAEIVWALLTQSSDFPRWNSTIISITGTIARGEKITLISTLDEKRKFSLTVSEFIPSKRMTWEQGMAPFFKGVRTYTLSEQGKITVFNMTERLSGLMFPLAAASIPDFKDSFTQYAADLKKEAELISNVKS